MKERAFESVLLHKGAKKKKKKKMKLSERGVGCVGFLQGKSNVLCYVWGGVGVAKS